MDRLFIWTGVPLLVGDQKHEVIDPVDRVSRLASTIFKFINYIRWSSGTGSAGWKYILDTSGTPYSAVGRRKFRCYAPAHDTAINGDPKFIERKRRGERMFVPTKFGPWLGTGMNISPGRDGHWMAANLTETGYITATDANAPTKFKAQASSWCIQSDMEKMIGAMKATRRIGWPLFTVCDSNSFHNVGYIMSRYAFANSKNPRPWKLVINFDAHQDMGGADGIVGSDTWGGCLSAKYKKKLVYLNLGGLGAAYSILYNGVRQQGFRSPFTALKMKREFDFLNKFPSPKPNTYLTDPDKCTTLLNFAWTKLGQLVQGFDLAQADVYATVDRDFMYGNGSMWGDSTSIFTYDDGYKLVSNVLKHVIDTKKARLVGFDVTGLPVAVGTSCKTTTHKMNGVALVGGTDYRTALYVGELRIELKKWYNLVADWLAAATPGGPKKKGLRSPGIYKALRRRGLDI